MAKFIELTNYDTGKPVFVNICFIESFDQGSANTAVMFNGQSDYVIVTETPEQIMSKIQSCEKK